ncbi:MAG: 50S ribosomal protein L2 [Candidatus Bathyarchaeota archaeon BA1]|nr:MAG: 50S ribosomal protein L2 [Candidatus Bathyarchaeota archaeon BA1]
MGKRIRVQRRGRGSPTFRAATHKRLSPVQYPPISKEERKGAIQGRVTEFLHEPGRGSPLASIRLETGETYHTVVPEGVYEGQSIQIGDKAPVDVGNTLPLGSVPEGTMICNIELLPGDGGKIARSSGSYAMVVAHTSEGTIVRLPSGKTQYLNDLCRATIGVVSGAGRVDKPFLKAGAKFHLMQAKGRMYPRTRGIAMVPAAHPYGSSKRGARKVTTVSRHAPPGRKVGLIAARSAGRKRKRRKG